MTEEVFITIDRPLGNPRVREIVQPWSLDSYPVVLIAPESPEHVFTLHGRRVFVTGNNDVFSCDELERITPCLVNKPVFVTHDWDQKQRYNEHLTYHIGHVEATFYAQGKILGTLKITDDEWRVRLLRHRLEASLPSLGISLNLDVRLMESMGFKLVTEIVHIQSVDVIPAPALPAAGGHFLAI